MTLDRTDPFEVKAAVLDLLGELTAEERKEVGAHFCVTCWMPKAGCTCAERRRRFWEDYAIGFLNTTATTVRGERGCDTIHEGRLAVTAEEATHQCPMCGMILKAGSFNDTGREA